MIEDESFSLSMIYVDEDECDDASGCYANLHEIIAILRCEALIARDARERGDPTPTVEDYLDALTDDLARQTVQLMDSVEENGLGG